MVSSKISELQAAETLAGPELVPIVQGGVNKRTTVGNIASMVMGMSDKCRFFKNLSSSAIGGVIFNDGLSYKCNKQGVGLTTMAASVGHISGKKYFEVHIDSIGSSQTPTIGVVQEAWSANQLGEGPIASSQLNSSWAILPSGDKYYAGATSSYGQAFTTGATVMVAVDIDLGLIWFGSGGVWGGSGNPAAASNPAFSQLAGYTYPAATCLGGGTVTANFTGPFTYALPAGFSAWDA